MKAALSILLALSTRAVADDHSTAEQLFEQGRAQLAAHNDDEACDSFRKSFDVDPHSVGTLLNLGLCNERQGKLVSAAQHYREVVERATDQKLVEAKTAAAARLAVLGPLLPRVTFVATDPVADEKILLDNAVVAGELEVDPGVHDVTASAPGYPTFATTVRAEVGKKITVRLPRLQRASPRKLVGLIGMAGGAGFVATAAAIFIVAKSHYNAPFDDGRCSRETHTCDPTGQSAVDSARSLGTAGTVVGIVGLAAVAAGAALYFTAPHLEATVVPTGSGVAILGRF